MLRKQEFSLGRKCFIDVSFMMLLLWRIHGKQKEHFFSHLIFVTRSALGTALLLACMTMSVTLSPPSLPGLCNMLVPQQCKHCSKMPNCEDWAVSAIRQRGEAVLSTGLLLPALGYSWLLSAVMDMGAVGTYWFLPSLAYDGILLLSHGLVISCEELTQRLIQVQISVTWLCSASYFIHGFRVL